jgi:hypothetical protein
VDHDKAVCDGSVIYRDGLHIGAENPSSDPEVGDFPRIVKDYLNPEQFSSS